ncbi:MAG: hypothetical protein PHP51_00580, partial [Desulfotomaculaceae bacterium]|nr:hypothetical protein [Desulfotomaculaceae bacterium]
ARAKQKTRLRYPEEKFMVGEAERGSTYILLLFFGSRAETRRQVPLCKRAYCCRLTLLTA